MSSKVNPPVDSWWSFVNRTPPSLTTNCGWFRWRKIQEARAHDFASKIVLFLSLRLDQGSKPYPFQFKREKKFSTAAAAKDVDLSPGLRLLLRNGMMVMMKPDALQRAAIWKRWALMLKIVFEHTNSLLWSSHNKISKTHHVVKFRRNLQNKYLPTYIFPLKNSTLQGCR